MLLGHMVTGLHGYWVTRLLGQTVTGSHGYWDTGLYGTGSRGTGSHGRLLEIVHEVFLPQSFSWLFHIKDSHDSNIKIS